MKNIVKNQGKNQGNVFKFLLIISFVYCICLGNEPIYNISSNIQQRQGIENRNNLNSENLFWTQ